MKVTELLAGIRKQDLVLPEFQREYVWTREQAKQLLVSLVKGYPVGGLLFWKTDHPPELKNIKKLPDKLGTIQIILDGQQRLTTLYLLLEGEVPPFYRAHDIQNDPRELYFHLGTRDSQYYQPSRMKGDPLWHRVVDCYCKEINVFEIAKAQASDEKEAFTLAQRYNDALTALRNIKERDLPIQVVPSYAVITEAIDIFDRVNSQGTKLTDADLALTHVTAKWPEARRTMKAKIDDLEERHFHFNLTFMTRALTAVVTGRALYEVIHDEPAERLKAGWARLEQLLDYLVTVLPGQAYVNSTEDLPTPNVLVPLIVYLDRHDGKFPDEKTMRHAFHWLYAALTWARYTSQTAQRLERDLGLVVRNDPPWDLLCDQIIDQRGRIEVTASDLVGRWVTHPLYRMTVILSKAHGAVDWFNGAPLSATFGKAYHIHSHHIFPQALLYGNGYDRQNHLHRKVVNEIANRAFLTAKSNLQLGATPPEEYLPEVDERYPGALTKQFVPIKPDLWKVELFDEFLKVRRALIAQKINEFMDSLVGEPEPPRGSTAEELRHQGESVTLEFKSTLRWDLIRQQVNKDLQFSVLKTIAAFLNTEGGTLVIGVEDDGTPVGLEKDLQTLKKPTEDVFQQMLMNLMAEHVGAEFAALMQVRFEKVEGKTVCVVEVDAAAEQAYMTGPRGKEFFIRAGNTSRALDAEATVSYVQMHWQ